MAMTYETWDKYCRNLTTLREFFERPEIRELDLVETPTIWARSDGTMHASYWFKSSDIILALSRILRPTKKVYDGDMFTLEYNFGDGIGMTFCCSRAEVCTRRVIGSRVIPAETETIHRKSRVEEIVEWDCHPLLEGDK